MILEPPKPIFLPLLTESGLCHGPLLIKGTQTSSSTPTSTPALLKKPDIEAIVVKTLQNTVPELLASSTKSLEFHPPSSIETPVAEKVKPLAKATIRSATSKDIHAIRHFTNSLLKTSYSVAFFLQFLYSKDCYCLLMTLPTKNSSDLDIVGVISGKLDSKSNKSKNMPAGLGLVSGHVYTLAVDPQYRRLGAASQLLSAFELKLACLAVADDCILGYLTLEVQPKNSTAIAFYDRNAFFQSSTVKKGYYNGFGDALQMKKVLL